jgi:hypothetical protein
MRNIVLYAVENGVHRPLVSCDPDDASRFFKVSAAGTEYARIKTAQGVPLSPLQVVLEERATDAGGVTLTKQEFTLLDPASFAALGKPATELSALGKKADAESDSASALKTKKGKG